MVLFSLRLSASLRTNSPRFAGIGDDTVTATYLAVYHSVFKLVARYAAAKMGREGGKNIFRVPFDGTLL